jgi:hypothetical protein
MHVRYVIQECCCDRLPAGSLLVEMVCVKGHSLHR